MKELFLYFADQIVGYQNELYCKTFSKEEYAMNILCRNTFLDILKEYYCCTTDAYDDVKLGFEEIMPTIPADVFAIVIDHIGPSALIRPDGSRTKLASMLADNRQYAQQLLYAANGRALCSWEHSRIWQLINE